MEESPSFATARSSVADTQHGNVTRFAFGLGAVAVLGALTIGYVTHRFAVSAAEKQFHNFYISEARTLVAAASMQAGRSDDEILSAIGQLWNASANRPPDEYLCIVDQEARLILHTANPAAVGNDAGENLVVGNETRAACTLLDLVQDSQEYVGGYVSRAGQQQIAAFAPLPGRGWVVGIHRSKAALESEIRSGVRLLTLGFLVVCGLLMPASLGLMARTYQIAQRKRRQAEAKQIGLGRILEDSLNEIYILSASTLRYIEVNRGARMNLGYTIEELVELTPADLMPDFTRKHIVDLIRPLRSGEREEIQFETVHRRKDGTRYDITVHLQLAAFGSIPVLVAIILDVSLRKRAEQALRSSEERYALAQKAANCGSWDWHLDSGEVSISEQVEPIFGLGRGQFGGTFDAFRDLVHPDDLTSVEDTLNRCINEGNDFELEFRVVSPDKTIRWVSARGDVIREPDGRAVRMLGTVHDITDRRRTEEAIQEKERQLDNLLSNVGAIVLEGDPFNIYYVGGQVERILGYPRALWFDDPDGPVGFWSKHLHPDDSDKIEICRNAIALGNDHAFEYRMIAADGREVWFYDTVTVETENGVPVKTRSVLVDITDRKRAERERLELEAQLRQSQKMEAVGRLAGGVAHDFNNILTAILCNVELSVARVRRELGSDHEVVESMEQIEQAAQRASALTRQLLTFSRRDVMQPEVLDLNRILNDLDKMLRRLITEDITLETVTHPELHSVRADAGQIEQVIVNLVVNAADAMPDGGELTLETSNITLDEDDASRHAELQPGPHVMLAVSDTGHGMDAATCERIFEPFFTTKPIDKGTGLGLATVHGIVKQSGGHIMVHSELGRGTTFKIYLPALTATPDEQASKSQPDASPFGHETVLLCEDDSPVRELIARSLKSAGYTVIAVGSGREGVEAAQAHAGTIDLLMTDVIMPDMNGRALSERLRATFPDLPTLFISGYTSDIIAHHGVLNEGVEFLEKPFTPRILLTKVRAVLGNTRSHA